MAQTFLSDGGGAGVDTLYGQAGSDVYVIRNANSLIVETAGNGTADRVAAGVSFRWRVMTISVCSHDEFCRPARTINLTGNGAFEYPQGNAGTN